MDDSAGVYIAHHPWLDAVGAVKVGHTGSLASRLLDSAYVTCFPEGWRYLATFETASKDDAHLLETAVLHIFREARIGTRELVRKPPGEIAAAATAAAAALGLAVTPREAPAYAARPREKPATSAAQPPDEPSRWGAVRPLIEALAVPAAAPAPAAEPAPDLVDELLELDWTPAPAPAPAQKPAPAPVPVPAPAPAPAVGGDDLIIDELDDGSVGVDDVAYTAPLEVREYQREATELCVGELQRAGVAILQMACRCGKTPVAYGVMREYLGRDDARVLFLVPGLSLLRQTAQKLASYGFDGEMLLVGSDPRPVEVKGRPVTMTTDPGAISAFASAAGRRLVISTYQSSALVPVDAFALTVFDEAHRVCGGAAPRPFNHVVRAPRAGARLFMTATPAYDAVSKATISMKDRATFGGVAYRYHLRRGIAAGYVNDFRLELVAGAAGAAGDDDEAMAGLVRRAAETVDKLLVFCRNIGHAQRLCAAVEAAAGDAPAPRCLLAHSRLGSGGVAAALREFSAEGARAILFNCRLFQEGVEIPALNGVFFAAPRHSPRDIIQSLCRPLNRVEGKPQSVVFVPVFSDAALPVDDPANLKRYASIIPFVDALVDEDPALYEHLLDPAAAPYPMGVLGSHTLKLRRDADRAALLAAVRNAVRYGGSAAARPVERLLRVENVPWDRGFAEVRRIVTTLGRYPKTTDSWVVGEARVCLHRFYRAAADEFAAWRAGRPTKLEPHQIHDLMTLPQWEPFGVEGPYPWRLCMETLEAWLRGGEPLILNVNNGGYVGLEATPLERLSGALTCVNQADGKARRGGKPGSGYTLAPDKQRDLERICGEHGLRWRKERDASGELVKGGPPTFIQEAHARFKALCAERGPNDPYVQRHYPGFPQKHRAMENLEVQAQKLAPPRWRTGRRRKDDGDEDGAA